MIKISNQKPTSLYDKPFDVLKEVKATDEKDKYLEKIEKDIKDKYVDTLFQPINNNQSVEITDAVNGKIEKINKDMIKDSIFYLWNDNIINIELQEQLGEIYRQSLRYHMKNDWYFEEQLLVEALSRMKLPLPGKNGNQVVKYSASMDIIPSAKDFLADPSETNAINWFANIGAYVNDRNLGDSLILTVQSNEVFKEIKENLKNFIKVWQTNNTIDTDVQKLLSDFDKISLKDDLSTCIFLPNEGLNSEEEEEKLSFTRIINFVMSNYEKANSGLLTAQPINIRNIYKPENIIIMNLENYAHTTPKDIKKEWDSISKAIDNKRRLKIVSNKKLKTAKSVNMSTGKVAFSRNKESRSDIIRRKKQPFKDKPITSHETLTMMKKVIESQVTKDKTQNTYKTHKTSYMRPNRRKPDDINLPGKITKVSYRPDIHIYLDTSGSISETQYRDSVMNLIALSKKINCNLYITSFSHIISQTSLLKTKDRSISQIYKAFMNIDKVYGGTEFNEVWRKINMIDNFNKKNKLSHQINFVITDFGYYVDRNSKFDPESASVKNTYYVPISTDPSYWSSIKQMATQFRESMVKARDYGIRGRMLM